MFNLLVAEDEEIIRRKIMMNIDWKANGFSKVFEAEDGIQALKYVENNDIDIVITDVQMPKMDGIELLKKIKTIKPHVKFVIISGHAEFDYAKESISLNVAEYILKPFISKNLIDIVNKVKDEIIRESNLKKEVESLKNQLRENREALKDKLFFSLLNNNFIGNLDNDLEYLGMSDAGKSNYFVAVLNADNFVEILKETEEEQKYIYNLTMFNWISQFLSSKKSCCLNDNEFLRFYIINYRLNQMVIIFFNEIYNVLSLLEELSNAIMGYIGMGVTVGIGNTYEKLQDMYISYTEACSAANLSFIYGKNKVYSFNDINIDNKSYSKQLYILSDNKLYDDLKVGAFEEIKKDIVNITQEVKRAKLNIESISAVMSNIILMTCKVVNEMGYNIFEIFGENFKLYFDVKGLNGNIQLEEWMFEFFYKINDFIKFKRNNRNCQWISEIKSYIDKNYHLNVNLTKISKQFNITPGYLSLLFNEQVGQNFIDYLTAIRIKKAKELLKFTDLRIYEIADKIGYNDAYYFSSAFKKIVGINPSDYRETMNDLK